MNENQKQITEFTFWDFCQSAQKAIQEGFTFSSDNAHFPLATVGLYTATMLKAEAKQIQQESSKVESEVIETTDEELMKVFQTDKSTQPEVKQVIGGNRGKRTTKK